MKGRLVLSIAAVLARPALPSPCAAQHAPTAPIWELRSDKDITYVRGAPFGARALFVGSGGKLICLDRETGGRLWMRDDIDVIISAFRHPIREEMNDTSLTARVTMVVADDKRVALHSVATGERSWDSDALPFREVRGFLAVSERGILLLYGKTRESESTIIAVNAETGTELWRNDALFDERPEHARRLDRPLSLIGHQNPLLDTDSTVILYVSKDGPIRVHVETGELLWRADALAGRNVPMPRRGYASLEVAEDHVIVPFDDKRLAALNRETGEVVWQTELPKRAGTMNATKHGLAVGSRPLDDYLDMLDPTTGESKWPAPLGDLDDATNAKVTEDTLYVVGNDILYAVDLASGERRQLATIAFEGGERPDFVYVKDGALLLVSFHNVMRLRSDGTQEFHRFLHKPGGGIGGALIAATRDRQPRQPTGISDDHVFIFTDAPDSLGNEGYSIVKVSMATGDEEGRIWLDDKEPDYTINSDAGLVYLRRGKREVVAYKF